MRILVCGGRDFANVAELPWNMPGDDPERLRVEREYEFGWQWLENHILDLEDSIYGELIIITGMATGADTLGYDFGKNYADKVLEFPADWNTYGRKAGPIRNKQMLEEGKPDLIVAFPGGRGTAHMVRIAKEAGVKVIEVKYKENE